MITVKKYENLKKNISNSWLGHKIIVSCLLFFRNSHSYLRNVQRKSVILTQQAKMEAKGPGEQQRVGLRAGSNECNICIKFRKMCLFQQPNWVREQRGLTNNYYKETIVFNNNHFTPGTIRYISST